jgi:acyl carrier protein
MTRDEIFEQLVSVIEESSVEDVDWSTVTEENTLESFGFDSLAVLDLIFDLEAEFSVQIKAEEVLEMKTVGELVTFLESKAG